MTPTERKQKNLERAKLSNYKERLIKLKDTVPNINELWQDNSKIVAFFESGKAAKFERLINKKPSKPIDNPRKPLDVKTDLTVEEFRELKEKGASDKLIREQYKLNINQLVAWKKANGVTGLKLEGGRPAHKDRRNKQESRGVDMANVVVEEKMTELEKVQNLLKDANSKIESLEFDCKEQLYAANLKIRELEASLEDSEAQIYLN